MARILIGWELGAGHGHTSRILNLADVLVARGHLPMFAPQQIGPFAAHGATWQAPVWPRMLEPLVRRFSRRPATMGDILGYLGLDQPDSMAAMLMAWDRLLNDAQPDVVVAQYAPMLQLAARRRVPVIAWGTGFSLPPDQLPRFPSFLGESPVCDEPILLAGLNDALSRTGRSPLSTLPEIFAADQSLVSTFSELDPYFNWRSSALGSPAVSGDVPITGGKGDELFIYFNGPARRPNAFWQGLAASRLPVRVFDAQIDNADVEALERANIKVERAPVPFAKVIERSRLLLSHGGLGFVSSGLLAGAPQVIIPFDVEKRLIADALSPRGLCSRGSFDGLDPEKFASFLRSAWEDEGLAQRAMAAAPGFRERATRSSEAELVDMIEALL